METSKTYIGNELSLEVAILQLARAVNELTFAVDRLVDKQHRETGDHASQDEYSHILDSLAKAKLQIQKTIDAILDDG